ncbi:carbohydrate-binding module family 20 [Chlorella sorokiniana]|uniref:Carbohydrate-binding module family 20 n=1 Tax=Chlorella sorokiniana TaxID=3076 RepID=A0A2P6U0R7_CHLSO|nr:carbohydrate-binding module family 20 [Chlorella sorokiniana]|eukprot:PRW59906.1 carbohydrate-binding module family 20 [Chlorella sorokiniana]
MSQLGSVAWRGSALRQAAPARRPSRQRAALCFSNADGSVSVCFRLPYRCKYGQKLCLVGSNDVLGGWHVDRAVPMNWTEGDVWTVELQLPANGSKVQLEYKYVVRSERDKSAVRWKEGNNCYLAVPEQGRLHVRDTWDDSMREVEFETPGSAKAAAPPSPPAPQPPPPQAQAQPQVQVQPPAAAEAAAPAARRGRPRKIDEQAQVVATISKAADKAMQQLDDAVSRSLDLLGTSNDPAAPELLAADRLLAAAAKRATTMHKALEAAKEVKALPPTSKPPRVRRKSGGKDGGDGQA